MKHRGLALALAGGCVILGIIAVFLQLSQDTTPPEIKIEERDITYTEGDSYEGLLEGVSASDKADGDLTSEVFVNKIVLTDEHAAVVYYGVMDESNNVGMARRRVNYRTAQEKEQRTERFRQEGSQRRWSPTDQGRLWRLRRTR